MGSQLNKVQKITKINAPSKAGVYIIMRRKHISRIAKTDNRGILYIGKAYNLNNRLKLFIKCGHIASWFLYKHLDVAYFVLGKKFETGEDIYPCLNKLRVIIKPLKKQEITMTERALLFAYTYHFGELPPLNFNLPGRQKRKPQKQQLDWAKRWILNAQHN